MSIASWKRQYYPKKASDCTEAEALEHSIRKWTGLKKENLKCHGLRLHVYGEIGSIKNPNYTFGAISGATCALCIRHLSDCTSCPLCIVRGGTKCTIRRKDETKSGSPYSRARVRKAIHPMLRWLIKARQLKSTSV